MKHLVKITVITFTFVILTIMSIAQNSSSVTGGPIILRYADSLVGINTSAQNIREFIGNVVFEQGNVVVKGDRAVQNITENRAEMTGNVVITQEDLVLKAPRINYYGNTGIADAYDGVTIKDKTSYLEAKRGTYSTRTKVADFLGDVKVQEGKVKIFSDKIKYFRIERVSQAEGNVKIEDDSVTIYADKAEHKRELRESYAYGNVLIKAKYENVILTGDTIINLPENNYTLATGNPILFQIDTVREKKNDTINNSTTIHESNIDSLKNNLTYRMDTLIISAESMEAKRSQDGDIYYFKKKVQLTKNNIWSKTDLSVYDKNKGIITLTGTPVVWYDSTQLHADSIIIEAPERKLSSIKAYVNAIALTREDTVNLKRINQISGDFLLLNFKNDTVEAIYSFGNSKSLYFLGTDSTQEGASRHASDTIHVEFLDGEPFKIYWLGGISGEFFPEDILGESPKEYYLPSFRWSNDKPKKKTIKIRKIF